MIATMDDEYAAGFDVRLQPEPGRWITISTAEEWASACSRASRLQDESGRKCRVFYTGRDEPVSQAEGRVFWEAHESQSSPPPIFPHQIPDADRVSPWHSVERRRRRKKMTNDKNKGRKPA